MKVMTIIAHPNPQSFNHALIAEFKKGLEEAGHECEIMDLYAENFNPLFGFEDFGPYMGKSLPEDIQAIQKRLNTAEALAFFFPVWWSSAPAMLKGWFDRVLTKDFAFTMTETDFTGILPHKKILIVNTTMGPKEFFEPTGTRDTMTKMLVDFGLAMCGVEDITYNFLYNVTESDEVRQKYLKQVYDMGKEF